MFVQLVLILPYDLVRDIEVAKQVETATLIVKPAAGVARVKDVKSLFVWDVQFVGNGDNDAANLLPEQNLPNGFFLIRVAHNSMLSMNLRYLSAAS